MASLFIIFVIIILNFNKRRKSNYYFYYFCVGILKKRLINVYEKINNDIVTIEDNDLLEKIIRTFEKRIKNMEL